MRGLANVFLSPRYLIFYNCLSIHKHPTLLKVLWDGLWPSESMYLMRNPNSITLFKELFNGRLVCSMDCPLWGLNLCIYLFCYYNDNFSTNECVLVESYYTQYNKFDNIHHYWCLCARLVSLNSMFLVFKSSDGYCCIRSGHIIAQIHESPRDHFVTLLLPQIWFQNLIFIALIMSD